jgi:tetratricopeptide (TPR) repeat protein
LVAAATGEILIARRETAQDSSGIVGAIDELSEFLRRRLGESLGSLRAEPPLSRAATGSLDALRKFTQAGRAYYLEGNAPKARELYEEAIGLDSTFGLAYVRLTDLLWHAYEHQIDRIAWTQNQSFAQRNRLPLRDRYLVEASYYNRVLYDFDKSIATYRALLELYPDDTEALSALGAVCFAARHYADGEAAVRRFVAIDSTSFYDWLNLSDLEIAQGKRQAAKQTVAHMVRLFPKNEEVDWWRAELEAAFGNYGAAEALLDTLTRHYPRTFYSREWTTWSQGNIAAVRGRLGKAVVYFRDGMAASTAEGNRARYFEFASTLASYQLRILRRPDLAVKELERALVQYPLDSLPALERPYFAVAEVLAQAGHPDRAQELLVQYERDVAPAYRPMVEGNRHTRLGAQGEIDLAEGRVGDAINAFRAWSEKGQCLGCGLTALARAFQRAGLPDSAVAAYERYLNTMWVERVMVDADELAATHRELGGLYALRGDTTRAVQAYERFLKLWENADQELQPQVAEVRRRLSDLRRETAIR